jgi:hypothetical protein
MWVDKQKQLLPWRETSMSNEVPQWVHSTSWEDSQNVVRAQQGSLGDQESRKVSLGHSFLLFV